MLLVRGFNRFWNNYDAPIQSDVRPDIFNIKFNS